MAVSVNRSKPFEADPSGAVPVAQPGSRWKYAWSAVAMAAVLVQWVRLAFWPHEDFDRHWEFGRRFVQGEYLYGGGLDIPYPPLWALAHAPLTILPVAAARILIYPLGVAALFLLFFLLNRLTRALLPLQ